MIARAKKLLSAGHGQISVRVDSGFYSAELMNDLREQRTRFTMSAPRTSSMWRAMTEIGEKHWAEAIKMRGAQVAETPLTPTDWKHEPLRLIVRRVTVTGEEIRRGSPRAQALNDPAGAATSGARRRLDSTYAYSFIITDIPAEEKSTT